MEMHHLYLHRLNDLYWLPANRAAALQVALQDVILDAFSHVSLIDLVKI